MKPIRNVRKIAANTSHATTRGRVTSGFQNIRSKKKTAEMMPFTTPMAWSARSCHPTRCDVPSSPTGICGATARAATTVAGAATGASATAATDGGATTLPSAS